MSESVGALSGALTCKNYLERHFDPFAEQIEDTVLNNPFFPLARALILETVFAKLPKLDNISTTARAELASA